MLGDTGAGGANGSGCGGPQTAAGAIALQGDVARGELCRTTAGTMLVAGDHACGEACRTTAGEKVPHGEVACGKPSGIAVIRT